MKLFIIALTLFITYNSYGQVSAGTNFFSLSNTVFNKPFTKFDSYPDSTVTDSTTTTGASGSVMFNYHVTVTKHISIGFKSRLLGNKESTYGITSFGPAVRYYFGFGPDEPKPVMKKNKGGSGDGGTYYARRFYNHETKERLKSLFFVEAGYQFGRIKVDGTKVPHSELSLQAGALFRFAVPKTQLIRHFGLELSAGVFGMTDEFEQRSFIPNVLGGLLIFLDKKYSSTKKIRRQVILE